MKYTTRHTFTAAVVAAVFSIASMAASPTTEDTKESEIDRAFPPGLIELTVPSHGKQMVGHLYLANGQGPHPTVIFLHGFPGNEKNLDVAQSLRRAGFNTLYFHYRGAWGSEGEFSIRNVTEDAAAAIAYVKANAEKLRANPDKISLFGHSLGGFNALFAGATDKSTLCTVAVAPAHFGKLLEQSPEENADIALSGANQSVPGLKNYSVGDLFTEASSDPEYFDLIPMLAAYKDRALLIVSGDKDTATKLETQMPLVHAAQKHGANPFSHIVMDADHSFSWRRIELSETIVTWMTQNCH